MPERIGSHVKALAEAREWGALEDAWIDALTAARIDVPALLEVAETVAMHDRRRAVELLVMLGGHLLDRRDLQAAHAVLRQASRLAPGNAEVKALVVRLCRERIPDGRVAEKMIEYADFDGKPLLEAQERFEALAALQVGSYVVHESWGPGKVVEFDTGSQEVVIDFVRRAGHRMSWGMALRALRSLPQDHVLAMTVDRVESLASLPPVELLVLAVRSMGGEAEAKDLRALLEPIVGAHAWAAWWVRAKTDAKVDPRVHMSLTAPLRVRLVGPEGAPAPDALAQLCEAPPGELVRLALRVGREPSMREGVRSVLRSRLPAFRRQPPRLLEALLALASLGDQGALDEARALLDSDTDPFKTVLEVRSSDLRRQAAELLESRGEAGAIRKELFLRSSNPADWEALARRMSEGERAEVAWEVYRGLPTHAQTFFWLVQKAQEGFPLPGTPLDRAMRLIGVLDEAPGLVGPVTSFVAESRLLQKALEDSRDKAEVLLRFLDEARLPVSLKEEIRADVYARFPDLKPSQGLIYTTSAGLQAKEEQLRHLLKVELPHNKAALAEARSHGDLRENFEYKAAKEQQERIMAQIQEIQAQLSRVRLLSPQTVDTSAVGPGCTVTLIDTGGVSRRLTILGPWDSDPDAGVYSYLAPAVQSLLGRRVGDSVELNLPSLTGTFRVCAIEPWTT